MVESAGSRRLLLAAAQYLILRRRGRDLGNRLILESVVFRSQAVTDRSAESRTGIPEGRVQAEVAKQPRDPKPSCVRHLTSHADLTLTPIHHHTHTSTPFLHPLQRHRAVTDGHSHFHHVPSRRYCVANTALGRDTSSSGNRPPLAYLATPPGDFIPARARPRPSQPHPPSRKRPTASQ